jgi:hypothetical protein
MGSSVKWTLDADMVLENPLRRFNSVGWWSTTRGQMPDHKPLRVS